MNALLKAIRHLKSLNLDAPAVVFADAEIQWDSGTLNELWKYWKKVRYTTDLVGAKMERNKSGPQIYGRPWTRLPSSDTATAFKVMEYSRGL
jgi:hypothetical protein